MKYFYATLNIFSRQEGVRRWWTGARDSELEGDWRWNTSGEPVGDFVWMRNRVQLSGDHRLRSQTKIRDHSLYAIL